MKTCCIIPCYEKPEFLYLTLEHVCKNPNLEAIDFVFSIDLRIGGQVNEELFWVMTQFKIPHAVIRISEPHEYTGNSFNLLTAVAWALREGYDLIHLLEDDVMVSNDYFDWHRKAHQSGQLFASVASKSPRRSSLASAYVRKDEVCYSDSDYAPYGVCFNAANAGEHIVKHVKPDYFEEMTSYVMRNFPDHPFGSSYPEQDGLIYRIVTTEGLYCVFPELPRCFHAGFYGYNRAKGARFGGSLELKINSIRSILHDKDALNAMSWEFPDLEPCNLDFAQTNLR